MKNFDWIIFILLLTLMISGIFFIYSASSTKIGQSFETKNYYIKQIVWILLSIILLWIVQRVPYAAIDFLIIPTYIFTLFLLVLVLFLPEIKGSHRWISLGFMNFQPSELAKVSIVLLVSKLISKPFISDKKIIGNTLMITLLPIALIVLQPDLGTALIILISILTILAVSDFSFFYLVLIISPIFSVVTSFSPILFISYLLILIFFLLRTNLSKVIVGFTAVINVFFFIITPIIWNNLHEYQQDRILSFINPARNPFGSGYQIIQSKIAIGSGGLFGKGFLMGTQKNLDFLPEHHTDFIFSIIGEEFGFLGCLFLLTLFFVFLYRLANKISGLKRKENRYAAVGLFAYLTFQISINIGMNIGIMPTTGIPLPFISYGGSNMLINVLGIGLILKFIKEKSIFK